MNTLPPKGAYLDLGCGMNLKPGFVGRDYHWLPSVDMCWDAAKGLPLDSDWIGGVFTEHMLEHIPLEKGRAVLRELFRVMQ